MDILLFLLLGGIAGWVASIVMGTDSSQGILMNIVVGIVGAVVGGLMFNLFGAPGVTGFNIYSFVVATIGAVVLLWIVGMVRRA